MKALVAIVLLSALGHAAADPVADEAKANEYVAAAKAAYRAGKYDDAFDDLQKAFGLVPRAATAALLSQTKMNQARDKPSEALSWLVTWESRAKTESLDAAGWDTFGRAVDAIEQGTKNLESDNDQLRKENAALEQQLADAKVQFSSLKAAFEASDLSPLERARVNGAFDQADQAIAPR
ncbi:MAG TPA: hypothetical protein VGM88_34690 [Kofleriaceae bacterium]